MTRDRRGWRQSLRTSTTCPSAFGSANYASATRKSETQHRGHEDAPQSIDHRVPLQLWRLERTLTCYLPKSAKMLVGDHPSAKRIVLILGPHHPASECSTP